MITKNICDNHNRPSKTTINGIIKRFSYSMDDKRADKYSGCSNENIDLVRASVAEEVRLQ